MPVQTHTNTNTNSHTRLTTGFTASVRRELNVRVTPSGAVTQPAKWNTSLVGWDLRQELWPWKSALLLKGKGGGGGVHPGTSATHRQPRPFKQIPALVFWVVKLPPALASVRQHERITLASSPPTTLPLRMNVFRKSDEWSRNRNTSQLGVWGGGALWATSFGILLNSSEWYMVLWGKDKHTHHSPVYAPDISLVWQRYFKAQYQQIRGKETPICKFFISATHAVAVF